MSPFLRNLLYVAVSVAIIHFLVPTTLPPAPKIAAHIAVFVAVYVGLRAVAPGTYGA